MIWDWGAFCCCCGMNTYKVCGRKTYGKKKNSPYGKGWGVKPLHLIPTTAAGLEEDNRGGILTFKVWGVVKVIIESVAVESGLLVLHIRRGTLGLSLGKSKRYQLVDFDCLL